MATATATRIKSRTAPPYTLWVGLVILLVIAIVLPSIVKSVYWINLLNLSMIFGICALGLNFVLGYAGQMSLGHAAFWGLGAYTSALLAVRLGWSPWLGLVGAILVTAAFSVVIGFPTLKLRGHYLAMATIGFGFIIQLVLVNWISLTMGSDGIPGIPSFGIGGFVFKSQAQVYYLILAVVLILCYIAYRIKNSRIGRAFIAIRENDMAAEALGVDTTRYKILAFCLAGVYAGIAGSLFAHSGSRYISPDTFSFDQSVMFLAMLVLGGSGTLWGAVIGSFLLTLLPEWLRFLRDAYMAVNAAAIILIMIFMPSGIAGLVTILFRKLTRKEQPTVSSQTITASPETRKRLLHQFAPKDKRAAANGPIIQMRNLAKHFGGLKAVDGVDIDVRRGAIHALIGPNGSGKTTIINMLSGLYVPTAGRVQLNGHDLTGKRPHVIASHGIGRTFQNIRLFPTMSVLENVMIGDHWRAKSGLFASILTTPSQRAEELQIRQNAMAMLEFVGLSHMADAEAKSLPYGQQRLLELARALVSNPDVLLLDEPAAGLNASETEALVELLFDITEQGITIFLVEHDMNLVMGISEDITVLNFGKKIAEGDPATVESNQEVITAYLGQEEA